MKALVIQIPEDKIEEYLDWLRKPRGKVFALNITGLGIEITVELPVVFGRRAV